MLLSFHWLIIHLPYTHIHTYTHTYTYTHTHTHTLTHTHTHTHTHTESAKEFVSPLISSRDANNQDFPVHFETTQSSQIRVDPSYLAKPHFHVRFPIGRILLRVLCNTTGLLLYSRHCRRL